MAFNDYKQFAAGPLVLPINGTKFTVPELGAQAGLLLSGALDEGGKKSKLDELPLPELMEMVLGSAYQQMVKTGVSWQALTRALEAALADFRYGRDVAEMVWETGGDPELMAARVAASVKSDAGTSTRKPASTTTTSTSTPPAKKSTRTGRPASQSRGRSS